MYINEQSKSVVAGRVFIAALQAFVLTILTASQLNAQDIIKPEGVLKAEAALPVLSEEELDLEPPVIDHESLVDGIAGESQGFTARVVDDRGVQSVLFHYRSGVGDYSTISMRQLEATGGYLVVIDTSVAQSRVEYFIEAIDTGGNRVLKGFPNQPLVRALNPASQPAPEPIAGQQSESRNNWLYIVLGALAVGLLAGAADSGGSSSTPPQTEVVPFTITASPP